MKVFVHLAKGFEEIEAVTVIDLLRRAEINVTIIKVGEKDDLIVVGAHGISVKAEKHIDEVDYSECQMAVLPGGMPGTTNLGESELLMKNLRLLFEQGRGVAAICAAPMVLAKEGILCGKKATIYPGMEEYLVNAVYVDEAVVKDCNVITGRGPGTATEFAIALIEALRGREKAEDVLKGLAK